MCPTASTSEVSLEDNSKSARTGPTIGLLRDLGRTIRLVWQAHPTYTLTLAGLTIVQGFLPAAQLWVWKLLFDTVAGAMQTNAQAADTFWRLASLVGVQAGFYILSALFGTLQGTARQLLGELLQQQISLQILEKANTLELAFFENAQFYDRLQNARREAGYRPLQIVSQLLSLGQSIITLSSMALLLVRLHWAILPIILITLLPVLLVQNRYGYANYWMLRQRAPEMRKQQYVGSLLTADWVIKEIRSFRLEGYLLSIFKSLFARFFGETRALIIRQSVAGLLASVVSILGWLAAIGYVIFRVAHRSITIGDLTLYTQAVSQTQGQLRSILGGLSGLYSNTLFIRNLFEFLAQPARGLSAGRVWSEPIREIEFRNVSFCYPGTERPVLQNVSFTVRRGQLLALIGKNGAGKTTLIKLLCRLYEPTSGEILINEKDISAYSPRSVQEHIAVIFQDYGHYHFTAQENIGLGRTALIDDLDAIETAARRSGAHPVIDALPARYETMLGRWFERGHELSMGEWQKIALARAYLRNGSIMILDEPTAAMDAEAEYQVFEELSRQAANQITLLVSHRFSTVRMAGHILVLDEGQVIEYGSHEELVSKNGQYAYLFRLQAQGYQPARSSAG